MSIFLQKLQQTKYEFLLYDSRPWQKSRRLRSLNSPTEQSAARAACWPSSPLMPTPTCAEVIIFTSLAPSPIASVDTPGLLFRISLFFGLCVCGGFNYVVGIILCIYFRREKERNETINEIYSILYECGGGVACQLRQGDILDQH